MDGKANKEGGAFERKSLRRPQFAPGQDALLDSAPPSDSLAQAFSTNPAAIRARKAREESRAQHGPPVKGPQAPAITGRVRVVATTNAASPGVAALHNGRTGVVTKRAAGWIEVQLDATRDKPAETIPCRKRDLVKIDEAGRALETAQGPAPALKRKPKKEWAERARREAGMRGEVEEEEEEAPRVVQRAKPKKKDNIVPLTTAEKAAVLHAIAQLDGKATQKKVRRAAESALGAPEGALDEKKAAVKEVCEDEMSKQAREELRAKRRKIDKPADTPQGLAACFAAFYPGSPNKAKFERFAAEHDVSPRFLLALPASKCEDLLKKQGFESVVVFTFQSRLREVCLG